MKNLEKDWKKDLEEARIEKPDAENTCKDLKAELEIWRKSSEDKCKENVSLEKLVLGQKK